MSEYKLVNVTDLENRLKEVCDTIRTYSYGEYDGMEIPFTKNINGIAQSIETVAFKNEIAGMQSGSASGYGQGRYYAAEQAQNFGNKTNYQYWKYYEDITNLTIPYTLNTTNSNLMFTNSTTSDGSLIDLSQFNIDFSGCTNFNYWLNESPIGKIGTLDTTSCTNLSSLLYNAQKIVTIDHLILKEDGSQTLGADMFRNAKKLANINQISGKFGQSFRLFQTYSITHETLIRILEALYDYSGTSTAPVLTIVATRVKDMLTDEDKLIATSKGWSIA